MHTSAALSQVTRRGLLLLPFAGVGLVIFGSDKSPTFTVPEVDLAKAKALLESGALVLDVRKQDSYQFRHIVGAWLMPLATLRLGVPASIEYAKSQPILVYCGNGLSIGPEATHILNTAGYTGAVNLHEGIEGWDKAGLPVKRAV
jgi:rhodanese-related sulfurtransferase